MNFVRIACVQLQALDGPFFRKALEKALLAVDSAAADGADLILLPESLFPSYYLGGMEGEDASWRDVDPCSLFSEKAKERKIHLATGLVLPEGRSLFNGAVLWGPDGRELLKTFKSNLWHFDRKYMKAGKSFPVAQTALGPIGMMVCADGRIPEICRILALKGAKIVLDLTNLTSAGHRREDLSNPQLEYMLPARAAENGVWIAVADKVGLEAETVLNCGGSCIIDPLGKTIASASSWKEEILIADVDMNFSTSSFPFRSPSRYLSLTKKTENTEAYRNQFRPLVPCEDEIFAALCCFGFTDGEDGLSKAIRFLSRALDQGNHLVCLPPLPGRFREEAVKKLSTLIPDEEHIMVLPFLFEEGPAEILLCSSIGVMGRIRQGIFSPVQTPLGNLGAVFGEDGWAPEPIRCLMIEGAEIVLWYDGMNRPSAITEKVARTRASENRIFVFHFRGGEDAAAIGPSGTVLTSVLQGEDLAVSAMCHRMESRGKTVIPGTNIITGRIPEAYGDLVFSGKGVEKERHDV